jgi:signal transduction histidine kinase
VIFSLAGVVLYFVLGFVVDDNLDEVLRNRADKITRSLKINPRAIDSSISLDHSIDIYKIPPTESYRIYSDTTIFDTSDHELIECRKITFTVSVDSTYYKIIITLSRLETEDMVQLIFYFMVCLFFLIVFILFILNRQLSSSLWHPFFKTLGQLKTFKIGQKNPVIFDDTSIVEFQQLNEAVSMLLQKVQSDYKNLKEFSENASHEIQTPLAIIRTKIETVLQDKSLTPEQHKQLKVVFESTTRLSKLNEELLLLSKIENRQFAEFTTIDLCQITQEKLEYIEELLGLKNIRTTLDIKGSMQIQINQYLAEILINNLLGNALKHTTENGKIHISGNNNQLTISNTGEPFTIEPEKIFQRFVKQSTANESSGLGLSIASEICKSNRLNLTYNYQNNMHCFCLSKKI